MSWSPITLLKIATSLSCKFSLVSWLSSLIASTLVLRAFSMNGALFLFSCHFFHPSSSLILRPVIFSKSSAILLAPYLKPFIASVICLASDSPKTLLRAFLYCSRISVKYSLGFLFLAGFIEERFLSGSETVLSPNHLVCFLRSFLKFLSEPPAILGIEM